jgi:hypothetical protein
MPTTTIVTADDHEIVREDLRTAFKTREDFEKPSFREGHHRFAARNHIIEPQLDDLGPTPDCRPGSVISRIPAKGRPR